MSTDLEDDLVFKRFDASRQEQIRQLVSYATLLGLSADDLVSIGNRLKRIKLSNEVKINKALIKDLYKNIHYTNYSYYNLKFTFTHEGKNYKCKFKLTYDVADVTVVNTDTGDNKRFHLKPYEVGSGIKGRLGIFLVNIVNGDIQIDF